MDEFTAMREDLLLRIMSTVEEDDTQFAIPSMVYYAATDNGTEAKCIRSAEVTVQQRRDKGERPFPDMGWQSKAELSDSLDYPPEGSALWSDQTAALIPEGCAFHWTALPYWVAER